MWTPVLPNCSGSKSRRPPCVCAAVFGRQRRFWQCHLHRWKHNLVGATWKSMFQFNLAKYNGCCCCLRKEGTPGKLKPRGKHPFKVNIWAGISKRSATPVRIFTGVMKKVGEILEQVLLPFTQSTFPDGDYQFQQDNDPKHKSKFITLFSY